MGKLTLITGGSRSGKSAFAQQLAEKEDGSRVFLATCPVTDIEMAERIQRHIADRSQSGWETIEEQVDIAGKIEGASAYGVVLVDCLTLWVNNLMYNAQLENVTLDEDLISVKIADVVNAAQKHPGRIILVTNEVGLGIVPDNKDARLYRDLIGRCNQQMAAASERVYLVSCGIPLQIKGTANDNIL